MDLIKTDQYGRQIGYVQGANIDFEVGADESDSINDFEIELKRWNWDGSIEYGSRVDVYKRQKLSRCSSS